MEFIVDYEDDIANIPADVTRVYWNIDVAPYGQHGLSLLDYITNMSPQNYFRRNDIPYGVRDLRFLYFDGELRKGAIPNSVTHLHLGNRFNQNLTKGCIPNSVLNLFLGDRFNGWLEEGHIPDSVTHLTFGKAFGRRLRVGHIPNSVKYLTFGRNWDQKLETGHIPNSVTHLIFGSCFNQQLEIGHIPNSVTYLAFGKEFNKEIKPGDIPDSVTDISFGLKFNQTIREGDLPDSIIYLAFAFNFNKMIECAPSSLETIAHCYRDRTVDLTNVPLYVRIYMILGKRNPSLEGVRHLVYIKGGTNDKEIIEGKIKGIHYIDTIEDDGTKYLTVHGDDYEPFVLSKSARKR